LNQKQICILTSGHPPMDDRIFWKFGNSLNDAGYSVTILCSTLQIDSEKNDIRLIGFNGNNFKKKDKIKEFLIHLNSIKPDLIICEEMLPVFAALKHKSQNINVNIVLDITEWYPENVAFKLIGIKRWITYLKLILPYILIINKVDHLIVGETGKLKRYKILSPLKSKTIIGYYPVLKYFKNKKPDITKDEIVFGYAGVITFDRGIINILKISNSIAEKYANKKFKLLIFGSFTYQNEEKDFHQLLKKYQSIQVEFINWTDYDKMSPIIEKMDICFDLRKRTFIYKNSLPIKIFEYMACGKPFIYSDIKPIRDELNFENYGFLVNPENDEELTNAVEKYLKKPELVREHSENSRKLIEENKNWENESKKLISLVNELLTR
jgi:glycosyltransferase involved in cell wall biosynthesis